MTAYVLMESNEFEEDHIEGITLDKEVADKWEDWSGSTSSKWFDEVRVIEK